MKYEITVKVFSKFYESEQTQQMKSENTVRVFLKFYESQQKQHAFYKFGTLVRRCSERVHGYDEMLKENSPDPVTQIQICQPMRKTPNLIKPLK